MNEHATKKTELRDEAADAAMEAARSLAHALGQSAAYKAFEAAHERLRGDEAARQRLAAFESRQSEMRQAAMWGGAEASAQETLEREWRSLRALPTLGAYLRAQEELTASLRECARMISEAIGVDYGAACSPSGGCC